MYKGIFVKKKKEIMDCDRVILKGFYTGQNYCSVQYKFSLNGSVFDCDIIHKFDTLQFNRNDVPKSIVSNIIDNYMMIHDNCDVSNYRWEINYE